jgi:hypothetical protein
MGGSNQFEILFVFRDTEKNISDKGKGKIHSFIGHEGSEGE